MTIALSLLALEIASASWLWALGIPHESRSCRTLNLVRNLTDLRPVVGFWAVRRQSSELS